MTQIDEDDEVIMLAGDDKTADSLLALFDDATGTFRMPMEQGIWPLARTANAAGLWGEGRTVVVLDSPPDMRRGTLASQVTFVGDANSPPDSHGTLVDLFILSIAPKARILHFDVTYLDEGRRKVSTKRVRNALLDARVADADVVCMSLGVPPTAVSDLEINIQRRKLEAEDALMGAIVGDPVADAEAIALSRQPPRRRALACKLGRCLCELIDTELPDGPMYVAAAGNAKIAAFCPALSARTLSVGFQTEQSFDTGKSILKSSAGPHYDQAGHVDLNLFQVHPAERSSFAAPRVAGLLSLMGKDIDLDQLMLPSRILKTAWQLEYQMTVGPQTNTQPSIPADRMQDMLTRIYAAGFNSVPALFEDTTKMTPERRLALQLFVGHQLTNAGFHLMNCGAFTASATYSLIARDLMPWTHEPYGNLAPAFLMLAKASENRGEPFKETLALANQAASAVRAAQQRVANPALNVTSKDIHEFRNELIARHRPA